MNWTLRAFIYGEPWPAPNPSARLWPIWSRTAMFDDDGYWLFVRPLGKHLGREALSRVWVPS